MSAEMEQQPKTDSDWQSLRTESIAPGGFGKNREGLWPRLLHVDLRSSERKEESIGDSSTVEPHHDERQIKLDTERSFVLYSVDERDTSNREELQEELHELLVSIFRKRRKLSYFQGYHDIITVLFLTLPKELQLPCAEKLSLHVLRDSMGSSLEPILGLLRILQRLLYLVDPSYAALLDRNSPLPYYALSNLLTLFSHDVPTLPQIQHIFDYLLSRPPIATVYLAAAVVLSRKEEVVKLEQEGEEGMLHSLLSSLPDLYEEQESIISDTIEAPTDTAEDVEENGSIFEETRSTTVMEDNDGVSEAENADFPSPLTEASELESSASVQGPETVVDEPREQQKILEVPHHDEDARPVSEADFYWEETLVASPPPDPQKELPSSPLEEKEEIDEKHVDPSPSPPPVPASHGVRRARVSLTSLLTRADELFSLYPPSHVALAVSTTMGPQSVVHTWSENPSLLPDDDEAESMVLHPELVVYPHIDSDAEEEEERQREKEKRRRRKLRKPRRFAGVVVERRVMLAGAVLVLGVAMAVYGMRAGHEEHAGRHQWKRMGRWVGGVLVGASERILDGFGR